MAANEVPASAEVLLKSDASKQFLDNLIGQATVTDAYYGPCGSCRASLRAELGGEAREVATADYEPKMNVTPNAVATKD